MGLFYSDMKLVDGENRIIVRSGENNIEKIVKYIRVNDVEKNIHDIKEQGIRGLVK